ncbi:hypothetical protein [Ferrimonas balearica]|uniref:hypothetical protein n=1 Tax=Ferrimonas balearica TaxID=44012 RepID=UPI001C9978E2|nr:hypothetical protein [Ferrimonas balearica]MBY5990760.1 hypothetical protein [Ferrimonas balearica]
MLAQGRPIPLSSQASTTQQALSSQTATLLPVRQLPGQGPVVMTPAGALPLTLPSPLPAGGEWWLRMLDPRTFQLVRPGPAQALTPQSDATAPASNTPPPTAALPSRPFEGGGTNAWQALVRAMTQGQGASQLSQLPLPSLAQLANPALLASLVSQIGQFPFGGRLAPPLGPLATTWQRLLGVRSRDKGASAAQEEELLAGLGGAERRALLERFTPMIGELAQFQQQSQGDSDHPLLYLALPYGQEREQRELQLSLQSYQARAEEREPSWLLTLRFELSSGELLIKARYRAPDLHLDALASTKALSQSFSAQFDALQARLEAAGLKVNPVQCRVGEVPQRLGAAQTRLTYGQHHD